MKRWQKHLFVTAPLLALAGSITFASVVQDKPVIVTGSDLTRLVPNKPIVLYSGDDRRSGPRGGDHRRGMTDPVVWFDDEPCRDVDAWLLEGAGTTEVCVVPTAAAFEAYCRPYGGTLVGVLAATALIVREMGGHEVYRTVVPFHTRVKSRWSDSVGWYVGGAPIEVPVGRAAGFDEALAMVRSERLLAGGLVTLLGRTNDQRVVVERSRTEARERRPRSPKWSGR